MHTRSPHWLRFWDDLERIGVWNWKPDYSDRTVLDGTYWRLTIEYAGRKLKTGGDNGYPGADSSDFPPDGILDRFLAALRALTGISDMR